MLKQIPKIGKNSAKILFDSGIYTMEDFVAQDARRLEYLLQRKAPFGNEIQKTALENYPIVFLQTEFNGGVRISYGLKNSLMSSLSKLKYFHILALKIEGSKASILHHSKQRYQIHIKRQKIKGDDLV